MRKLIIATMALVPLTLIAKPRQYQPRIDFSEVCRLAYKGHVSGSEAQNILNEYLSTINEPPNTITVPELCEVVLAPSTRKLIKQSES